MTKATVCTGRRDRKILPRTFLIGDEQVAVLVQLLDEDEEVGFVGALGFNP